MKVFLVICLVIFSFIGCIGLSQISYRAKYNIGLAEVERPADAKKRYGEIEIKSVQEEGIEKYLFEDELVKIFWIVGSKEISFQLENKTDYSIKINWDEAAFVDIDGSSHRIIHSGVKYIDRNNPMSPSIVVKKGTLSDIIVPSDNITYSNYLGWYTSSMYPVSNSGSSKDSILVKDELDQWSSNYVGKTIKVLLPLKIEDVVNEYLFTFKISDVVIEQDTEK